MCDLDEKRENQEIWFNTVHLVETHWFSLWAKRHSEMHIMSTFKPRSESWF